MAEASRQAADHKRKATLAISKAKCFAAQCGTLLGENAVKDQQLRAQAWGPAHPGPITLPSITLARYHPDLAAHILPRPHPP